MRETLAKQDLVLQQTQLFPFTIQGRPSQYSQGTRFIIILGLHHILSLGNLAAPPMRKSI